MLSLSFFHLFHIFSPIWLSRAAVAGAHRGADPTLLNLSLSESFRPDWTGFLRYTITLFHKFQLFFSHRARPWGSAQVIDSILWILHSQKCSVFFSQSFISNDTIIIKLQVFKLWNYKRRKCGICVANRLHLLLQFNLLSGYLFSHGYNFFIKK